MNNLEVTLLLISLLGLTVLVNLQVIPMILLMLSTFLKTYLDGRISSLKHDLNAGNEFFAKKLKEDCAVKLKGEGNQVQFSLNSDIIADLNKLQKRISPEDSISFPELSSNSTREISSSGLRTNRPLAGKPLRNTKVMIWRQIRKTKNVSVQQRIAPSGLSTKR